MTLDWLNIYTYLYFTQKVSKDRIFSGDDQACLTLSLTLLLEGHYGVSHIY